MVLGTSPAQRCHLSGDEGRSAACDASTDNKGLTQSLDTFVLSKTYFSYNLRSKNGVSELHCNCNGIKT